MNGPFGDGIGYEHNEHEHRCAFVRMVVYVVGELSTVLKVICWCLSNRSVLLKLSFLFVCFFILPLRSTQKVMHPILCK